MLTTNQGKVQRLVYHSVHAPTEEKSDEEKEKFYADLQNIHNKIHKHDIVIILGDLNAKIRKEDVYQNVVDKYNLRETTQSNGE
jgi:exonuclease III